MTQYTICKPLFLWLPAWVYLHGWVCCDICAFRWVLFHYLQPGRAWCTLKMTHVLRRRISCGDKDYLQFLFFPFKKVSLMQQACICTYIFGCYHKPGLLYTAVVTSAGIVGDVSQRTVDGGEIWLTYVYEMGSHTTNGHLGDVCEWLADSTAEEKHTHLQDTHE